MSITQRLARMALALIVAMTISVGMANLLGADFFIYNDFEPPFLVILALASLSLTLNIVLCVKYAVTAANYNVKHLTVGVSIIVLFVNATQIHLIMATTILPLFLIFILSIKENQIKSAIIKTAIWVGFLVPFELIMAGAKRVWT